MPLKATVRSTVTLLFLLHFPHLHSSRCLRPLFPLRYLFRKEGLQIRITQVHCVFLRLTFHHLRYRSRGRQLIIFAARCGTPIGRCATVVAQVLVGLFLLFLFPVCLALLLALTSSPSSSPFWPAFSSAKRDTMLTEAAEEVGIIVLDLTPGASWMHGSP